jgi:hypothetical protein
MEKLLILILILIFYLIYNLYNYLFQETKEQFGDIQYLENSRSNYSTDKYFPCFKLCNFARNIFDILENYNLVEKYQNLLNVMSLILCQEKYALESRCKIMINDRIDDLKKLGFEKLNKMEYNKANSVTYAYIGPSYKLKVNSNLEQLIVGSTYLIEKELNLLVNDLNKKDYLKVIEFIQEFYKIHYNKLIDNCLTPE